MSSKRAFASQVKAGLLSKVVFPTVGVDALEGS